MTVKRILAAFLGAALFLQAPGLPCYRALAADVVAPDAGGVAPVTPSVSAVPAGGLASPTALGTSLTATALSAPSASLSASAALPQAAVASASPISVAGALAPSAVSALSVSAPAAEPRAASVSGVPQAAAPASAPASAADAAAPAASTSANVKALSRNAAVRAAVDTGRAAGQGAALQKIYDGVGTKGADRAVFANATGPVFSVNYQPGQRLARPTPRQDDGRTPVHLLVGSGSLYGRSWSREWAKNAIEEISGKEIPGLKHVVIDDERFRPTDGSHFIAADLLDMSEANKQDVAQKVLSYLEKNGMVAVGANTLVQGYIRMAPVIQEAVRQANNPSILVNPAAAAEATVDKLATRTIVGEQVDSLKWPAISPGAVDDPQIEEKAVQAFREVKKKTPSGKVVLKLVTGAGKAGLRAGGIATEEEMRESVRGVVKELKEYWGKNADLRDIYVESDKNGAPRLLIEGMIDRLAEVDVELSISVALDGTLDVQGFIIGNPNPGDKEKGYLFGMNGLLSAELQRALILSSIEAVAATWGRFAGLPFGNFHVEMILRGDPSDPKPALVEINGTRPIGGNGVRFAREWHSDIDLIRNGVRAALGLPQEAPSAQPQDSLLALGITPAVTGTVTKTESAPELTPARFADFGKDDAITKKAGGPVFIQASEIGEKVEGADSPHPGGLGAMVARGANAPAAVKNVLAGLDKTNYEITQENGEVRAQKGSEEHSEADYRVLPEGLSPTAKAELDRYEEAQLRWVPIFKVYYPLFSALMNAMGGLAAIGIGRVGYTLALFVSTPFASVVAAHLPVKKVLAYTWMARVAIWAGLVPLAVLTFSAGATAIPLFGAGFTGLQLSLFGLNFLDGLMVSFSHTVDMDAGGMDEVAKQNGFRDQMTPEIRKQYGARYLAWSSKAQYLFPLGIALAVTAAAHFAFPIKWAFLAGMAATFLFQGGRALWSINKMNSDVAMPAKTERGYVGEFTGGLKLVAQDKKLLGLVSLETLERSIGDALFMVAFPMLGLFAVAPALHLDDAGANLASTILVSIMSFAGMKASIAARKNWKAPEKGAPDYEAFKPLFPQMLFAGATLLSLPVAYYLMTAGLAAAGLAVAAAGAALFMTFFKKAQVGAMNMFQTAAGEHEGSTRIFGIASAVSMLGSGFVVWALESLFSHLVPGLAFVALSGFFLAVGAAYWLIWPRLATKADAPAPAAPAPSAPEKKA